MTGWGHPRPSRCHAGDAGSALSSGSAVAAQRIGEECQKLTYVALASYLGHHLQSGSGVIEISPVKGRSWASITNVAAATPVAKIAIAIRDASLLSLCTMAIATRAQTACMNRHNHLSRLTCDWLMMMRCRRASNAVSSAVAISRCAIFWPSLLGLRARVAFSASASTAGIALRVAVGSHHGPFPSCSICNIAADQLASCISRFSRKARRDNYDASQRASLAIDFRFGLFVISPNLGRGNTTKRPKMIPKGGSKPGEMALNERARSPTAKTVITA